MARIINQWVRMVFGARPTDSMVRSTPAMSSMVRVWGSRSPMAGDHHLLHWARSRARVDSEPPRAPPTRTLERRADLASCQRTNHSSHRTPSTSTPIGTSGVSSGSSAGSRWVTRHRAWARTASSSVS